MLKDEKCDGVRGEVMSACFNEDEVNLSATRLNCKEGTTSPAFSLSALTFFHQIQHKATSSFDLPSKVTNFRGGGGSPLLF